MIFRRHRCPIDADTAAWIADCVGWMTGGADVAEFRSADLVLPTRDFMRRDGKKGHALAEHIFQQVKELAGLDAWPCRLEAQEADPEEQVGEFTFVRGREPRPLGTFRLEAGRGGAGPQGVVSYNPRLLDDPVGLVATFAHELAHYFLGAVPTPPPGGQGLEEFATDLAAIFLGFGIFTINSSYTFEAFGDVYGQGWKASGAGYLAANDQCYALALFVHFVDADRGAAIQHLESRHQGKFRACLDYLDRNSAIADSLMSGRTPPN